MFRWLFPKPARLELTDPQENSIAIYQRKTDGKWSYLIKSSVPTATSGPMQHGHTIAFSARRWKSGPRAHIQARIDLPSSWPIRYRR